MANPTSFQPFVSSAVTVSSKLNSIQGIKKNTFIPDTYVLTGTTGNAFASPGYGALYIGIIDGLTSATGSGSGTWYNFSVPAKWKPQETSAYGPEILSSGSGPGGIGDVALAGTWINSSGTVLGWYYKGALSALRDDTDGSVSEGFQSFQARTTSGQLAKTTFLHSVDGGLVVGNYTTTDGPIALYVNSGRKAGSFIYNPSTGAQIDLSYADNARNHTVYGIWKNENNSYTISGGASHPQLVHRNSNFKRSFSTVAKELPDAALGRGMVADVDPITGKTSNLHSYTFNNDKSKHFNVETHFEGIFSMGSDVYQMPFVAVERNGTIHAGNAYIHRLADGQFSKNALWQAFEPTSAGRDLISTSVAGDADTGRFSTGAPFASIGNNQDYFIAAQNLH